MLISGNRPPATRLSILSFRFVLVVYVVDDPLLSLLSILSFRFRVPVFNVYVQILFYVILVLVLLNFFLLSLECSLGLVFKLVYLVCLDSSLRQDPMVFIGFCLGSGGCFAVFF